MLNLFDTAGQETYEHLRPLMYPSTDVILICFAVNNPGSLTNVVEKWQPEVRLYLTKTPILLLGLKTDLRRTGDLSPDVTSDPPSPDSVFGHDGDESWGQKKVVSYTEGQKIAAYIGAKAYFECSSKFNEGLTPIFQEAARLSLVSRRKSSIRDLLKFGRPKTSSI